MTRFVLVHGGWHGGWAWRAVRTLLEGAGHVVATPTLAGFGDEGPAGVTLRDAVDSLVAAVERNDLTDVVLVGHSWGGIVAGAAAPRLRGRITHLAFLSAYLPQVGQSQLDLMSPDRVEVYRRAAASSRSGGVLPPDRVFHERFMNDASREAADVVHGLLQPQPWRTWADPLEPDMDFHPLDVPRSYLVPDDDIACGEGDRGWVARFAPLSGGPLIRIPGAHEAMFTQPAALAGALAGVTSPAAG